jgi:hypothetical protein
VYWVATAIMPSKASSASTSPRVAHGGDRQRVAGKGAADAVGVLEVRRRAGEDPLGQLGGET